MDYSHGDPEASCPQTRFSGNASNDHMRYKLGYSTEMQPLSESVDGTDTDTEYPELKSTRVSFKPSSISIEDLRQESKTLLDQKRPKIPSPALYTTLLDKNALQGDATIFDLCAQDRHRVGHLIKQLVASHDRNDDLQKKLHEAETKEKKYKQKCGDLMKKLDALDERSRKLENDKEKIKQGYMDKLTALQNQITCISSKLELSAQDLYALKEENKSLHTEVRSLQTDKSAMEVKYKEVEKECRSTKSLLHTALEREINHQNYNYRTRADPNSCEQGVTRIFPIRNYPSTIKAEDEFIKSSQRKTIHSIFPSSSSISSAMEEKEKKSEGTSSNVKQRFDTLKGLQDKEAAILQDLFFIF